MVDVNDARAGKIAEVISNKTSKKILTLLADNELSESEIAGKLDLPANTVNYNIKKLVESGLIEKKSFLWSAKGRRVPIYRVSNKKIVISPKPILKGVLPAVLISGLIAFGIKLLTDMQYAGYKAVSESGAEAVSVTSGSDALYNLLASVPNSWAWFFIGALTALLIYVLWNWFKS